MNTVSRKPGQIFRALSDETRLRILNLLLTGELCVCDIVAALGIPQPTASRHLAYLRRTGLVTVRKESVWCYYKLTPAFNQFELHLRKSLECCATLPWLANDRDRLKTTLRTCCD